jgi:dihydroxyacetone kinase-like predicted kinase
MFEALCGKETDFMLPGSQEKRQAAVDIDLFTRDSVLEFGYCTEFMLRLTTAKTDPDSFEVGTVTEQLTALGGESIVAYKTGDIIKIHVHTFTPGKILECAQKYGEFLTVKIENMSLGHSERIKPAKKPDNGKKYAVVAVASGEGMAALFREMGADAIVSGGQTSNPSTQDFVRAFGQCAAEDIIVLPNHKNIILAAEQAAKIYEGARVHVVESRSFMQGFGALSVLTPGITDIEALITSARNAAASVEGYQVTRAVRDAEINGAKVKNGEYIAIGDGGIAASAQTANEAVLAMLENADTDMCEIITLFAGADTSAEQRAELTARINELYPDLETVVYESGQEIYDYYVALE